MADDLPAPECYRLPPTGRMLWADDRGAVGLTALDFEAAVYTLGSDGKLFRVPYGGAVYELVIRRMIIDLLKPRKPDAQTQR